MKDNIDEVIQRTQRYWYVDGLTEIAAGSTIFILGLFYLVIYLAASFSGGAWLVGIGQPLLFLLLWFGSAKAVKALKERITYPRTGFVSFPRKQRSPTRRLAAGLTGAAVSIGLVLFLAAFPERKTLMPVLVGLTAGLLPAFIGYRLGLTRFYLVGLYSLLVGVLAALYPLEENLQMALLTLALGLSWIVSGGVTLARYLRATRPLSVEDV